MQQRKVLVRVNVVRKVLACFLVLLGFRCIPVSAQSSPPTPAGALPVWTATWDQKQLLYTQISHPGYKIRLPPGYAEIALAPDENMTTASVSREGFGWKGPAHETGGFPLLFVQSATLRNVPKQPVVPRDLVKIALTKDLHGFKDIISSGIEDGVLDGFVCARVYWKGTQVNSQAPDTPGPLAHGFMYVTWNPQRKSVIWVECQDIDPYYSTTSKELEAAALSLKPN